MATMTFEQKLDNVQNQLDVMRGEDASFRSYTNHKFDEIIDVMATKDDLYRTEERIMSVVIKTVEKLDKIAEKVGVST